MSVNGRVLHLCGTLVDLWEYFTVIAGRHAHTALLTVFNQQKMKKLHRPSSDRPIRCVELTVMQKFGQTAATGFTMGGLGSKQSFRVSTGKYRIKRHLKRLCVQRKRDDDIVQHSRPIRFFNITKTTAEASVTVNKKVFIRAYLVPDTGTAATQVIEFQAEPDVEHILEFEDLKPGTLYRLKMYYVSNTYKRMLSSTGREILQSIKSDKMDGRRQNSKAAIRKGTMGAGTQPNDVLIRRATGGTPLENITGRQEEIRDVTLPREGFAGEKPVGVPMNYPKKLEVRTLPADWKGKEAAFRRVTTKVSTAVPPKASMLG